MSIHIGYPPISYMSSQSRKIGLNARHGVFDDRLKPFYDSFPQDYLASGSGDLFLLAVIKSTIFVSSKLFNFSSRPQEARTILASLPARGVTTTLPEYLLPIASISDVVFGSVSLYEIQMPPCSRLCMSCSSGNSF